MSQGLTRWVVLEGKTENWFARVQVDGDQTIDLTKAEYDAAEYTPPFWDLRPQVRSYSAVVAAGMKRLCEDFSRRVSSLGFVKSGRRAWGRAAPYSVESIHFHRRGHAYGGSLGSASISIRVELTVYVLNVPDPDPGLYMNGDQARRKNGYAYHHRFNAATWSTYERCVDELMLFVEEFAEPWFADLRKPDKLLAHPNLSSSAKNGLEEAIAGRANNENIDASLKRLGLKKRPPRKRQPSG